MNPPDFVGIYARAITVSLPSKWFHQPALPNTQTTTLRLGGYDVLIGTGSVSGKFMLETIPVLNIGQPIYYFDNEVHFDYDTLVLLQQDIITHEFMEVRVTSLAELKEKLFPAVTNPPGMIPPFSFKFPLTVKEQPSNIEKTFENVKDYQAYLNSLPNDNYVDGVPTLWAKIGSSDGFAIGLNKFDITLKQGTVTDSSILGRLRIPKLKNAQDQPAELIVNGHLQADGDFNLTV